MRVSTLSLVDKGLCYPVESGHSNGGCACESMQPLFFARHLQVLCQANLLWLFAFVVFPQANRCLVTISTGSSALGPELFPVNFAPVDVGVGKLSLSVSKPRWFCFHTDLVAPCEQVQNAPGGCSISRKRTTLPLRKVMPKWFFPLLISLIQRLWLHRFLTDCLCFLHRFLEPRRLPDFCQGFTPLQFFSGKSPYDSHHSHCRNLCESVIVDSVSFRFQVLL